MRILLTGLILAGASAWAQTPASAPALHMTATTANIEGAPDSVRIDVTRWSTDAERDQLMSAWKMTGSFAPARAGRGGRGGGRGGGGRGGGEPVAPPTPESTLAGAVEQAPTVGYLWSSEVAGYALRYAGKVAAPDGSERIILITSRRFGTQTGADFSVIELRVNSKGEGEGRSSPDGKVAPDAAAKIVAPENYDSLPVILKNVKRK